MLRSRVHRGDEAHLGVADIVFEPDLGVSTRTERAAELAEKAVGSVHPEIIAPVIVHQSPGVAEPPAGLNGVAPRDAVKMELVIDMKDGACASRC